MPARLHLVPSAALLVALSLSACGSGGSAGSPAAVAVMAGDDSCVVAQTTFEQEGKVRFAVRNTGQDVTEVYVYATGTGGRFDKVVGEVENVAPGVERTLDVELKAGSYEVVCKPGQQGNGIRTAITVAG